MEWECFAMRLVLMGPPGAGKGTQATELARRYGVAHISTGDMFRKAMSSGSEVGNRAKGFIDAGKLVPDDITLGIVRERFDESDAASGFILDGFPRTVPQANGLDQVLADRGWALDAVILIDVPEGELVRRAAGRRVCSRCNHVWHLEFNPPPSRNCACGGDLIARDDDKAATVLARLEVYRNQTEPLRQYYDGAGLLRVIDGTDSPDEVKARIISALERCRE